jgi:hypothetical protein
MRDEIYVWLIDGDWHSYPWRFAVRHEGKLWRFIGVPNYCKSHRHAVLRARAKARNMFKISGIPVVNNSPPDNDLETA